MEISPLESLENRFPVLLPSINGAIDESYSEVEMMLTTDRCKKPCWRDYIPKFLYSAVQTNVCDKINLLGIPDLRAEMKLNSRHNLNHVEIYGPDFVMTISSADGDKKPRPAVYRDELSTGGQINWFREFSENDDEDKQVYFTITHQINKDELQADDIRIILMSSSLWSETINESIRDRQMPIENITQTSTPVAKEETITKPVMPELKITN